MADSEGRNHYAIDNYELLASHHGVQTLRSLGTDWRNAAHSAHRKYACTDFHIRCLRVSERFRIRTAHATGDVVIRRHFYAGGVHMRFVWGHENMGEVTEHEIGLMRNSEHRTECRPPTSISR